MPFFILPAFHVLRVGMVEVSVRLLGCSVLNSIASFQYASSHSVCV